VAAAYGSPRRKAESLELVVADARCVPSEVLFVGDTISDQRAAREAGVSFVGRIPTGERSPFEGEADLPTVSDLVELDRRWAELTTARSER
jgi:phosphoglycolate phosphatase-like HAD superfamily hydrolase